MCCEVRSLVLNTWTQHLAVGLVDPTAGRCSDASVYSVEVFIRPVNQKVIAAGLPVHNWEKWLVELAFLTFFAPM
jgi:hypothetical protein